MSVCTYFMLESAAAAGFVGATCLLCTLAMLTSIARGERYARTAIHKSESRGQAHPQAGLYQSILSEALGVLQCREDELEKSAVNSRELQLHLQEKAFDLIRLQGTFDSLPRSIAILDENGRLQFMTSSAKRWLAAYPGSVDPTSDTNAFDLQRIPQIEQLVGEILGGQSPQTQRVAEIPNPHGDQHAVYRATATGIYDREQSLLGIAVSLEETGTKTFDESRHTELVSAVAHEFKTPLASIRAFVEMILDGDIDDRDEMQDAFRLIDVQTDRLARLVNNLLVLARIENGDVNFRRENCDLDEILKCSVASVQPIADEKELAITSELDECSSVIFADRELLQQAITNLLSNAAKYTESGGQISLRKTTDEDNAVIEVQDSGVGIPEGSLQKIFDKFYRAPGQSMEADGSGLGLTLVSKVITHVHNGSIDVSSTVDRGTCFTIRIPLGPKRPKWITNSASSTVSSASSPGILLRS